MLASVDLARRRAADSSSRSISWSVFCSAFRSPLAALVVGSWLVATPVAAQSPGRLEDPVEACDETVRQPAAGRPWDACACYQEIGLRVHRGELSRSLGARAEERLRVLAADGDACGLLHLGLLAQADTSQRTQRAQAEALISSAAARFAADGEPLGVYWSRRKLGAVALHKSQSARAGTELGLAAQAARRAGALELEVAGRIKRARARIESAEGLLESEQELRFLLERLEFLTEGSGVGEDEGSSGDLAKTRAHTTSALGQVLQRGGRSEEAAEAHGQAAELFLAAGRETAAAAERMSAALARLEMLERTVDPRLRAEVAADLLRRLDETADLARAARDFGLEMEARRIEVLLGPEEGRVGRLFAYLALSRGRQVPRTERALLRELVIELSASDPPDAAGVLAELDASLPPGFEANTYLWQARARVAWSAQEPDEAWRRSREILGHVERERVLQLIAGARREQPAVGTAAHDWLAGLLFARSTGDPALADLAVLDGAGLAARLAAPRGWPRPEEGPLYFAFQVLERSRELLLFDGDSAESAATNTATNTAQKALYWELSAVQGELLSADLSASERSARRANLEELQQRLGAAARDAGSARLAAAEGLGRRLPEVSDLVDLPTARSALGTDEALLVFQSAPRHDVFGRFAGGSWLLTMTRDAVRLDVLPEPEVLTSQVDHLVGLLAAAEDAAESSEPSAALYDRLLRGAIESLPPDIDHLILSPSGPLRRLPFAALGAEGGEPLGQRYRLSRVPSATAWLRWRAATSGSPGDALLSSDRLVDHAVVVLSSCGGAGGIDLPREGCSRLAKVFHRTGASAVVYGLWTPRDEDEAGRFFGHVDDALDEGDSVAGAVRSARRAMAGERRGAWSRVVVSGDGAYVPFPGGRPSAGFPWLWAVLLTLMASLGAVVLRRRGQRGA